jgi:hypothetical protein
MRSTALLRAIILRTTSGMFLTLALAFMPANTFAQRAGAAAHAAAPRPSIVRIPQAPDARAPQAPVIRYPGAISRPNGISPLTTRPILTRPGGVGSLTQLRSPLLASGVLLGLRPPRRLPIGPILPINPYLASGLFGLGLNGLFPCSFGLRYGCGMLPPYYGYGFPAVPQGAYPADPGYPTPDPDYAPLGAPSASLQYTPLPSDYSSLASLPEANLSAANGVKRQAADELLLYFKDGSVFTIASYRVSRGKLRYVTAYGDEGDIEVVQLDVQKTIKANAARGVTFTLTPPPSPAPGAAAPGPPSPGPAEPGPINPAKL